MLPIKVGRCYRHWMGVGETKRTRQGKGTLFRKLAYPPLILPSRPDKVHNPPRIFRLPLADWIHGSKSKSLGKAESSLRYTKRPTVSTRADASERSFERIEMTPCPPTCIFPSCSEVAPTKFWKSKFILESALRAKLMIYSETNNPTHYLTFAIA